MEYGTIIKNDKTREKSGVLRFSTGKEMLLNIKEMEEFDDWIKSRIFEYGGKIPKGD